jgi:putative peptidoglycan lipid II flippase
MLLRALQRDGVYHPGPGWTALLLRGFTASLVMGAFLYLMDRYVGDWTGHGIWAQIGWLTVAVAGGACVYFATALAVGLRPGQFRMHDQPRTL